MSGRDSIGKRPLHRLVDFAASELSKRVSDIGRIAAIKIKDLLRRFDLSKRKSDTVGQPPGAEIFVSHMPSSKAKKLEKPVQEKWYWRVEVG